MITVEQVLYDLHMQLHPNGQCKRAFCSHRGIAAKLAPLVHDMIREEAATLRTDLRDAAEAQRELAASNNELLRAAAGRFNFVAKYGDA